MARKNKAIAANFQYFSKYLTAEEKRTLPCFFFLEKTIKVGIAEVSKALGQQTTPRFSKKERC